ncbi:zinc knuckle CX2CX4HX4C containing protein [Tanacetum coccineum]
MGRERSEEEQHVSANVSAKKHDRANEDMTSSLNLDEFVTVGGVDFAPVTLNVTTCLDNASNTHGNEMGNLTSFPNGNSSTPVSFATLVKGDTSRFGLKTRIYLGEWASYARAVVELRADVELKTTIVVVVPKFIGEGYTMSTIHVEYEWAPPRCSSCQIFGHVLDECPKKIVLNVLQNLKNLRPDTKGVPVGSKPMPNFIYRPVHSTRKTNKAPAKPKVTKATIATTSTSNSFDALNTLVDDHDCGGMNPSSAQEAN